MFDFFKNVRMQIYINVYIMYIPRSGKQAFRIFLVFTKKRIERNDDSTVDDEVLAGTRGWSDAIRDRRILSWWQADPPCPSTFLRVPGSKTSRAARRAYISQNQIASKVHSPDSPSVSKEVGRGTSSTMQTLVSAICPVHILQSLNKSSYVLYLIFSFQRIHFVFLDFYFSSSWKVKYTAKQIINYERCFIYIVWTKKINFYRELNFI